MTATATEPHVVQSENARKMADWLANRGGLAIWHSVNLSNPGASWTTPANQIDGKPTPRPTWEADSKPERIIMDAADVIVSEDREVKRFHVAVRRGSQGFMLKCTDASSDRIHREVARAGNGAYYEFDYDSQEAVIMAPARQVSLVDWLQENG